jgi:hypothetical protein
VKYANFSTSDHPVNPRKSLEKAAFRGFFYSKIAGKICEEPGKHFTISREAPRRPTTSSLAAELGMGAPPF